MCLGASETEVKLNFRLTDMNTVRILYAKSNSRKIKVSVKSDKFGLTAGFTSKLKGQIVEIIGFAPPLLR